MDPRMRGSLPELETVFAASPSAIYTERWGQVIFVFGGIGSGRQFCSGERGRGSSVSDILHRKALLDAETRYPPLEKWALALVVAARKLRPYFQAFPISVITNQPLRQTLHKPDASGRLVKWAIELSEFDIDYKPRAAIKAQAMADFVAEFAEPEICLDQLDVALDSNEARIWQMSVDGSSGEQGSGAGIVLEGPEGEEISYAIKLEFAATNN